RRDSNTGEAEADGDWTGNRLTVLRADEIGFGAARRGCLRRCGDGQQSERGGEGDHPDVRGSPPLMMTCTRLRSENPGERVNHPCDHATVAPNGMRQARNRIHEGVTAATAVDPPRNSPCERGPHGRPTLERYRASRRYP